MFNFRTRILQEYLDPKSETEEDEELRLTQNQDCSSNKIVVSRLLRSCNCSFHWYFSHTWPILFEASNINPTFVLLLSMWGPSLTQGLIEYVPGMSLERDGGRRSKRRRATKQAAENDGETSGEQQSNGGERWNKRRWADGASDGESEMDSHGTSDGECDVK